MRKLSLLLFTVPALVRADWMSDVGYTALVQELGAATPTGAGVQVTQVEASSTTDYAPFAGSGTVVGTGRFSGISFQFKSGATGGTFHASEVGSQLYGRSGFGGRVGMVPGLASVHCYEVNRWLDEDQLHLGSTEPNVETSHVANHSWAGPPAGQDALYNTILRTVDYSINRDDYVCVVGVENTGAVAPTPLLGSAYNTISAGLSDGNHAHGLTRTGYDGVGRVKPELVTPLDFTSYSSAVISGAAALLRQSANTLGGNATSQLTLKAILLAGATKEEFSAWNRTATRPLDLTYGAGELNVANSYHILMQGEQTPHASTPVATRGWDFGTTNTLRDYVIVLPSSLAGSKLSAVLTWNRIVTDSPGPGFTLTPSVLPNFSLTLEKQNGSTYSGVDTSNSEVDNVEHIYQTSLPSGTYRLRASKPSNAAYAIAWRISPPVVLPRLVFSPTTAATPLAASQLVIGQAYELKVSSDLAAWQTISSFTATATAQSFAHAPWLVDKRYYYRLTW